MLPTPIEPLIRLDHLAYEVQDEYKQLKKRGNKTRAHKDALYSDNVGIRFIMIDNPHNPNELSRSLHSVNGLRIDEQKESPTGGLEPPTTRLRAWRSTD